MSSWISFYTDNQGYGRLGGFGTASTDPEIFVLPDNSVDADEYPLPTPLNQVVDSWGEAFELGLTQYYIADSNYNLTLAPMTSYFQVLNMDGEEDLNMYRVTMMGYPSYYVIGTPQLLDFFSLAYPAKLVSAPITWDMIRERGVQIINSLTPWVNSSTITGQPIDPSVVSVQAIAANPEGTYDTPDEAYPYFRMGAEGLALSVGAPWPPPLA